LRPLISNASRLACLCVLGLSAFVGCGPEEKKIEQAPITKQMEDQAEASSKHMMEQMQPKKTPAK